MADIKISLDGDLDLSSGDLEIATGGEEARQRIDLAITLNLGEFFSHINYGLPWIENKEEATGSENLLYFLSDRFPNSEIFIKDELDRYIKNIPFVASLVSSSDYNSLTREFTYKFSVVTTAGEEINFPPYLQQLI